MISHFSRSSSTAEKSIVLKAFNDKKRHIAIITDNGGNILSIGMNSYTMPFGTIHAEDDAINNLLFKVSRGKMKTRLCKRLILYVFAISEDLKMSKPCSKCQKLLDKYDTWFSRIYYSTGEVNNIIERYY